MMAKVQTQWRWLILAYCTGIGSLLVVSLVLRHGLRLLAG